jgi:twitching motility two-component system response regulator PilH
VWGERQGAKDYLVKPVEEQALMATVNRCLSK